MYLNDLIIVGFLAVTARDAVAAPGDLDPAFGADGKVVIDARTGFGDAFAAAIQTDGKIVVGGYRFNPSVGNEFLLTRLNADGTTDVGFGTGGLVATALGGDAAILAMSLLAEGKILVVGPARIDRGYDVALARFEANGLVDTTFGSAGITVTHLGTSNDSSDYATGLAIAPDNRIAVSYGTRENSHEVFAVLRYDSNGHLDPQFGNAGIVTTSLPTPVSTEDAFATSVGVQSDGRIVVGGRCVFDGREVFALVRYNIDGSLDASFGASGKVLTPIGTGHAQLTALTIQSDGKILASGVIPGGNAITTLLVRYNTDGSLDSSFGEGGIVLTNRLPPDVRSISLDSIGRIVLAGTGNRNNVNTFAVLRYHSNGTIDANFGIGGVATIAIGSINDHANALAIQSDGNIVAVGHTEDGTGSHGGLVRVNGGTTVGLPYLVEYYHWLFGHYFISLDPHEIHDLDTGVHPNWFRTGEGFKAYTTTNSAANPVCRFYIPPAKGDSFRLGAGVWRNAHQVSRPNLRIPGCVFH